MHLRTLLLAALVLWAKYGNAQNKLAKWGEIPPEDLAMTHYIKDSTCKALVLQDLGSMFVYVDDSNGPSTRMSRQRRIKIFHKDAFDKGNIFIPFSTKFESISDLRATVTSPGGVTTKVKSENIFTEKLNDRVSAKKIFLPNIEEGSIVEYGYIMEEEGIMQPNEWYFQGDIPTRFSRFEFEYPDVYEFVMLKHFGKAPSYEQARLTNREAGKGYGNRKLIEAIFEFEDLAAIKEEPFMTTANDYMCRVGYQLKNYQNNLGMIVPVFSDWNQLAKEIEEDQVFGGQYNIPKYSNDILKAFKEANPKLPTDQAQLAQLILEFVSKTMKWNGQFRWSTTDKTVDDAYKKATGSSADLNLAILALCREFKLESYPILVSTRSHGAYIEHYPILRQFNSVLASVIIQGKLFLLDGTSPYHYANMVEQEHSNYYGWMVKKDHPGWVEVKPVQFQETIFYKAKLDSNLNLEGDMSLRLGGKAGISFKESYAKDNSADFIKKRYKDQFAEVKISDVKIDASDNTKPASLNYKAHFEKVAQHIGSNIYLPIMVEKFFYENPLVSPERTFPVQLPYPIKSDYIINLTIPDGYVIDYIPEATKLVIEQGPSLMISASKSSETEIQVRMALLIKEHTYTSELYPALRNFFSGIIEKQDLQIVLKKI